MDNSQTKSYIRYLIINALLIVSVLLCISILNIYLSISNNVERKLELGNDDSNISVIIEEKGRWSKADGISTFNQNGEFDGGVASGYGQQYNFIITNNSKNNITDWKLDIKIPEDCYINKAWDGYVTVNQLGNLEKIDLMNFNGSGTNLKFTELDMEYMFILGENDNIVFTPYEDGKDQKIESNDKSSTIVGIIFYYFGSDSLVFNDVTLTYKLEKSITSMPLFWILMVLLIAFVVSLINISIFIVKYKNIEKRRIRDEMIIEQSMLTFIHFIDAKDEYTDGHSKRVAEYSMKIARKMGKNEEEAKKIYRIALMHDCGKIGISDSILEKKDSLTKEEYDIVKKHTEIGGKILEDFTSIEGIKDGALYHHERFDGKGYPAGLKGSEIPEVGRIICVADSFDAMNSIRCYSEKRNKNQIIDELIKNKGNQFDPVIVDILLGLIDSGEIKI